MNNNHNITSDQSNIFQVSKFSSLVEVCPALFLSSTYHKSIRIRNERTAFSSRRERREKFARVPSHATFRIPDRIRAQPPSLPCEGCGRTRSRNLRVPINQNTPPSLPPFLLQVHHHSSCKLSHAPSAGPSA